MNESLQAKVELAGGAALMTVPYWVLLLYEINIILASVTALCGAILGVHAVYRLWCRRCEERKGKG